MKQSEKKLIVISGVNLFSGGTLTILRECLQFLENNKGITSSYSILALVHKIELFQSFKNIDLIAFPKPRGNWLYKLYYEYYYFRKVSERRKVYLWFSLHDMTPNVTAERRAVYCHNPSPFYKINTMERKLDTGFTLFTLFYKYLYAFNIKKNYFVIVQQSWIRQKFVEMFSLSANRVIVAHPNIEIKKVSSSHSPSEKKILFFYPALPRVFKNFEVIVTAITILKQKIQTPFEVAFTIHGTENKYARYIKDSVKDIPEVKLIGLQNKEEMNRMYAACSCLLFPSKLETWGLPITEAKLYELPMLVADLPYAKETAGNYDKVSFFEPDNFQQLANLMICFLEKQIIFSGNKEIKPSEPFSESWEQTFNLLLQ